MPDPFTKESCPNSVVKKPNFANYQNFPSASTNFQPKTKN